MSERAKIHLGDIQCECLKRSMDCEKGGVVCDYRPICHAIKNEMPLVWDLSDPPRFTEAQMAFWRALYKMGVESVAQRGSHVAMFNRLDILVGDFAWRGIETGIKADEKLDLAELLGKDGAEC